MKDSLPQRAAQFDQNRRRRQTWYRAVSCMACVVVFCTVYALILPAITLEKEPACGLEEHIHTEECYAVETIQPAPEFLCSQESLAGHVHDEETCYDEDGELVCGYADFVVHTHDDLCYDEDGRLACPLPEIEEHQHDESCYRERRKLTCGQEEDGHRHDGTCYTRRRGDLTCGQAESEGHTHGSGCYETERELACGLEEDGDHTHDDSCYRERQVLTCTLAESEGHTHSDACCDWTEELTCGLEETEGHIHDDSCYTTETVLTCRKEEVVLHTHDESCFDEDGALICGQVQVLEHQHTQDCVVVPEGEPEEVTVLVCGLEEHTHTEKCYSAEETQVPGAAEEEAYLCGLEEHTHGETCYDAEGALICELAEHIHSMDCLTEEDRAKVEEVIALIDALPSSEEIEQTLNAYDEAGDMDGYDACFMEVFQQARSVYIQYEALGPELWELVSNREKLLELKWLWSAATLELPAGAVTVADKSVLKNAVESGKAYIQLDGSFAVDSALTVPAGKDVTLDLNGHTLMATGTESLFKVPSGTSLTIVDSRQEAETATDVSGNLAGNTGRLSNGTLTYYVTTTSITNSATGATEETLEEHTVNAAGAIVGGNQPVFSVSGGTLTIQSGMIRSGTNRAINQTGGVTNFAGGYICGFSQTSNKDALEGYFGGAVRISGGTLELSGGVLAGNAAPNGGGIYATGSAKISITGGAVSGNTANRATNGWDGHKESGAYRCGGGGIYADGSTEITMSGGYITNNVATDTGYFDGGGVCLSGTSSMTLSGGYVTGNQAQGGGGIRTDFGKGTKFQMTGGFVSANVATSAEGGGVAIDRNGIGTITGGYITNNQIPMTGHWGGGGLFCADGSTLELKRTLITENTAGGFGAGVAGCPTGKLYLYVTEGCAIYDNTDTVDGDSPHFTSDGVKQIDKEICTEFFQANGHADYFCALNSTVTGTMLGDNAANWQGSADYKPVIADAEDLLSATRVMGLQAHPTEEGKRAAEAAAKVYINGNYSYTHGGGIMCNGNLVIGVPENIEVPARVELQATKSFRSRNGGVVSMEDNDFSFRVTMTEPNGTLVAEGVCDSSGKITFDHQLTFKQAGTFVYYVYEEADGGNPSVQYDPTLYRLTVAVERDNGTAWYGDTTKYTYSVTSIKVEKRTDDGESWTTVSENQDTQSGIITLPLTSGATFTNYITVLTKLTVQKVWADDTPGADSVIVILKKDDEEVERQTLSAGNDWSYAWTKLEAGHSYTVEEVEIPGYIASYEVTTESDGSEEISLGQGSWWVPATELTTGQQYLIVSPDGAKALYIASDNEGQGFDTADVTTVEQQQTAITVGGKTYDTWYRSGDIPARSIYNAEALTRSSHSGIVLKRSDSGSYPYLRLESNNNNYLKGGSTTTYASFMVFDGTYLRGHNASEWTPDNLRTLIYADGKFNSTTEQNPANAARLYTLVSGEGFTSGSSDSSTVVITNTRDASADYELPETGGPGTSLYTLGGLCLMAGALLLYRSKTRGKGGRDSPC